MRGDGRSKVRHTGMCVGHRAVCWTHIKVRWARRAPRSSPTYVCWTLTQACWTHKEAWWTTTKGCWTPPEVCLTTCLRCSGERGSARDDGIARQSCMCPTLACACPTHTHTSVQQTDVGVQHTDMGVLSAGARGSAGQDARLAPRAAQELQGGAPHCLGARKSASEREIQRPST